MSLKIKCYRCKRKNRIEKNYYSINCGNCQTHIIVSSRLLEIFFEQNLDSDVKSIPVNMPYGGDLNAIKKYPVVKPPSTPKIPVIVENKHKNEENTLITTILIFGFLFVAMLIIALIIHWAINLGVLETLTVTFFSGGALLTIAMKFRS